MVDVLVEETLLEIEALEVKTGAQGATSGGREEIVDVLVEITLVEKDALEVKTGAHGFNPLE